MEGPISIEKLLLKELLLLLNDLKLGLVFLLPDLIFIVVGKSSYARTNIFI